MAARDLVREYYNTHVQAEWDRIPDRPEFLLTCRYMDRYIRPGDRVLDIGGGPGRYTFYLAEKGCDVTLLDFAENALAFARDAAARRGLSVRTVCGDACAADTLLRETFDHVLLMGPLYHLLEEAERAQATAAALRLLKPGGLLFASFMSLSAGMLYAMKLDPDIQASMEPCEIEFRDCFLTQRVYAGDAFAPVAFLPPRDILPFMTQFPLEKLHFFGQESILSPCESIILSRPKEIVGVWLDYAERLCEREDLLSWADHLMYIGRYVPHAD